MEELIKDKKNGLLIDVDNIEELSNAILNYKIINVEHSSVVFNNQKFELLFQRLIH